MIEGIDYYPRQKKYKKKPIIWILLLISIVAIGFWYFSDQTSATKSQPILIKVNNVIVKPDTHTKTQRKLKPTPKVVENLDEVIRIHNQENR